MPEVPSNTFGLPETPQELARVGKIRFFIDNERLDPHANAAVEWCEVNRGKYVRWCKGQMDFWAEVLADMRTKRVGRIDRTIEDGDYTVVVTVRHVDGAAEICLKVYHTEWAEQRAVEVATLFPEGSAGCSMVILADRLGAHSDFDFRAVKVVMDFDPSSVVDLDDLGLDENVMELVRLLNMIGATTTGSCGGHEDGRRPYLHFSGDCVDKVVTLFRAWEVVSGLPYIVSPSSELADSVCIDPPPDVAIDVIQRDLDGLTDFLKDKLGGLPDLQLSLPELRHRAHRQVMKQVGE